jgi:hypothetical protein
VVDRIRLWFIEFDSSLSNLILVYRIQFWFTDFRGMSRRPTDRYDAQISESKGGVHHHRWLDTFDTAEDAARAYDRKKYYCISLPQCT